MVFHSPNETTFCPLVYFGPGLSGCSTNVTNLYKLAHPNKKQGPVFPTYRSLTSQAVSGLTGFSLPESIRTVRLQVPPRANAHDLVRDEILRSMRGLVFVADSQVERLNANIDGLWFLETFLHRHGKSLETFPWVIQYNKRDLPNALPRKELEAELNRFNVPSLEAVACRGLGVVETFTALIQLVGKNRCDL